MIEDAPAANKFGLYEESQAAVSARDEFFSIASHERRTPLTPLAMQVHRLTTAIRKGTFREMPAAVLERITTTIDSQIDRGRHIAAELGASGFIAKPARVDELISAVARFC